VSLLAHLKSSTLRAGDVVEVRPADEILAMLDERGRLDGLPFMPEMLQFSGRRFRVQSRAHKACETVTSTGYQHLEETVHLDELRCDGASHGGCDAACLLFWKDAWLRRVDDSSPGPDRPADGNGRASEAVSGTPCSHSTLLEATRGPRTESGAETYSCQATELKSYSRRLRWWDVRQYIEDVESRNVRPRALLRGLPILLFNKSQAANRQYLPRLKLIWHGNRYPFVTGTLNGKTPEERLDLKPGELVKIKPQAEIERTLNRDNKNRGLLFEGKMSKHCGQTAVVRSRVSRVVNEATGEMIEFSNELIMLEGVVCTGEYMQFCPRRIFPWWRENWLERVET
jgi:hypothetical protein